MPLSCWKPPTSIPRPEQVGPWVPAFHDVWRPLSVGVADPPRPFDFLVNGELVRKTLEKHLLDHQLSAVS